MIYKNFYRILIAAFLILVGCKGDDDPSFTEEQSTEEDVLRVLFIGNSHTNFNGGIDSEFNDFAQNAGILSAASRIAPNGFSLEDHLNSTATLNLINNQSWDYIVLQENTYRATYETDAMLESISQFSELLQSNGATVYLFRTWAYEGEPSMNDALDNAYAQASTTSGYQTIAIGSFWKEFNSLSSLSLYNTDMVHPNESGTYLSAGIFFKKIFNYFDLQDLTHTSTLDSETAEIIKTFISNINI